MIKTKQEDFKETSELSKRIRKRREELKLGLKDVAEKVGVATSTVLRWENGEIKNVRTDKLVRLAQTLSCTQEYLLGLDAQNNPSNLAELTEIAQSLDEKSAGELLDFAKSLSERKQK